MTHEDIVVGGWSFLATLVVLVCGVLLGLPWLWVGVEAAIVALGPLAIVQLRARWVRAVQPASEAGDEEEDGMSGVLPGGGEPGAAPPGVGQATVGAPVEAGRVVAAPAVVALPPALSAEQLGTLRATLVAANPSAIPELIAGATFDQLTASVATANAAGADYARRLNVQTAAVVLGGGGAPVEASVIDGLSGEAKIAYALGQRNKG